MREGQLAAALATILRSQNAVVIPLVANKYSMPGCADKYVCHNYWRGFMEFKVAPEQLEPAQQDFCKLVVDRGDNYCAVIFPDRDTLQADTNVVVRAWKRWEYAEHVGLWRSSFKFGCGAGNLLSSLRMWQGSSPQRLSDHFTGMGMPDPVDEYKIG